MRRDTKDYSNNYNKNLIFGEVTATKGATNTRSLYQIYGISAGRAALVRKLFNEFKFKIWWYVIFLSLGIVCLIIEPSSWINVLELLVLMVSVDLIGRANRWGQIIAIIECFLYAFISFSNGLYGELFKSLAVNLPLAVFALISWTINLKSKNKNKNISKELTIKKLSAVGWIITIISFFVLCAISYFVLKAFNTTALILSAITLSISIVCKVLNAMCYKESWFLTTVQCAISLGLWTNVLILGITSGEVDLESLPMIVVYLANLTNSIYSYILWKAMYKKVAVNGVQIFNIRPVKIHRIVKLRKRYKNLKWKKEIDVLKNS